MKEITKLILLASIASFLVSCGSNEGEQQCAPIVKVSEVTLVEGAGRSEFAFISKPYRSSELSFRVGGPIDRLEVYSGNFYKKGDVIAKIDPRDFVIRKNRAEAIYNQAKAEAERIEVLFNKNNVSASSYERAKAEYVSAKMAYETAVNDLSDTELKAPFDGYVGEVYIERYQDVKATEPIVTLVDISRLKIEAYVSQDVAFAAKPNQKVNLHFDASPQCCYSATVADVSKSTMQNNLSYMLTAILPNADSKLLAGMSGKIYFETESSSKSLTVPQSALCNRPSVGDYVWVVDPLTGKVMCRDVVVGELHKSSVTILEGLDLGETVATSGLRFLSEGSVVCVSEQDNS